MSVGRRTARLAMLTGERFSTPLPSNPRRSHNNGKYDLRKQCARHLHGKTGTHAAPRLFRACARPSIAVEGIYANVWIVDAHGDGKRFIVRADEKLTAFIELAWPIRLDAKGRGQNRFEEKT